MEAAWKKMSEGGRDAAWPFSFSLFLFFSKSHGGGLSTMRLLGDATGERKRGQWSLLEDAGEEGPPPTSRRMGILTGLEKGVLRLLGDEEDEGPQPVGSEGVTRLREEAVGSWFARRLRKKRRRRGWFSALRRWEPLVPPLGDSTGRRRAAALKPLSLPEMRKKPGGGGEAAARSRRVRKRLLKGEERPHAKERRIGRRP